MNKQEFVDKLNGKFKYRVSRVYIDNLLDELFMEKDTLRKEILTLTYIDLNDRVALLKHLNLLGYKINSISSFDLMELYNESPNVLVFKLAKYYVALERHEEIRKFKDNLDIIYDTIIIEGIPGEGYLPYLKPTFSINEKGTISITKPNIPFTKDEMQQVLWYEHVISFQTVEDIIEFLQKYKKIIKPCQKHSPFFIQDTTLFFSTISNDMNTELSMEAKVLLRDFENHYLSQPYK